MTDSSLDEVLAELAEIGRRISELPEDAFDERLTLQERRRTLHGLAAQLRERNRSVEEIEKELRDLHRMRDEVLDRHLSPGHIGGGGGPGGGGIEISYVQDVNRAIDQAGDLAGINRRIRELEAELGRRGGP